MSFTRIYVGSWRGQHRTVYCPYQICLQIQGKTFTCGAKNRCQTVQAHYLGVSLYAQLAYMRPRTFYLRAYCILEADSDQADRDRRASVPHLSSTDIIYYLVGEVSPLGLPTSTDILDNFYW